MLKEGLYEDREQRDTLLALARFRSTTRDGLVSLDDYVAAMRPGQEAIYTITGDNLDLLRKSPQLEGFRARGVEVLLLTDPIDEFWVPAIGTYKEKPFKSATRGGVDLDKIAAPDGTKNAAEKPRAAGQARQPDRDLQTGARRRGQGRAQLRAADRQRGVPRRRRGRSRHAPRTAAEAAPPARHHRQAHPRTQPAHR